VRTPPQAPLRPPPRRVTGSNDVMNDDEMSNISSPLLRTPKRRRRMPDTSTRVKVLVLPTEPSQINLDDMESDSVPPPQAMGDDELIIIDDPSQEEVEVETTDPCRDSGVESDGDIITV